MASRSTRRAFIRSGGPLLAGSIAGCFDPFGRQAGASRQRLAVGSKQFTENKILAYMAYELVKGLDSVQPVHQIGYGRTADNWNALLAGDIDCYWDYTGTIWHAMAPRHTRQIRNPLALYNAVVEELEAEHDLVGYNRAAFSNHFTLLSTPEWVERTGVETISDLAAHVSTGGTDLPIAVGQEFYERPDGWRGLLAHYGLSADVIDDWDDHVEVIDLVLAYEFLESGDVEVVMGFSTDPQIDAQGLVAIADDREFFPIYNPFPLTRRETADEIDGLARVLDEIGPTIGTESRMRELNSRVILEGEHPQEVARSHLRAEGLR